MATAEVSGRVEPLRQTVENHPNYCPAQSQLAFALTIYPFAEYAKLGGLVACAVDLGETGVGAAGYVHKMLQGSKPCELPYFMPTKLRLTINLKLTA